ncbi:WD40-repeat-containing domain protein [Halteromyces radiatus]|uniref:WD40-repeat-containing domain protein n=1 Tax=Halteromyces radiatus TaxID=101107 RepID=UPI00221F3E1C|nr:WD40-repeat-containing domain protein [Halteromyces radiatus]KAI8086160.1 WD40-repeat-containing domain protein [Halteromyces radiatus]
MKVKALSRSSADYVRERSQDIHKVQRNLDPTVHPFEQGREYVRALNSVKLGRLFAKPFVGALSGHIDGVYSMMKHPQKLNSIISGSGDGEIRIWDLTNQETSWTTQGHSGIVSGVSAGKRDDQFLSCSTDKTVKIWQPSSEGSEALQTYIGQYAFTGLSHHRHDATFATSGHAVELWDEERSEPIQNFAWGADSYQTVKFNQVETNILASCGSDRTVVLYDLRTSKPLSKLVMMMKTNAIAWNPIEAYTFAAANEDHNSYIFDMRNMSSAHNVLKDHVSAVMDIDYSPTGQEIVTGSYDRSVRIFDVQRGHSRDMYHTKRMQRVFCVQFSMDSKYVLSGSDDGNIRLWKAHASEKLGIKDRREQISLEYAQKLKDRFGHLQEIKRIDRHRHVPMEIKRADRTKKEMINARKVKEERRRKHSSKEEASKYVSERSKSIIGVAK